WRGGLAKRELNCAKPLLDLLFRLLALQLTQIGMGPRMTANRVPPGRDFLENVGMPERVLADDEECGFRAVLVQCIKDSAGVVRPRTCIERQSDLLQQKEVVHPVLLEAEPRSAGCIDLDRAGNSKRIRIARAIGKSGCPRQHS